MLRLFGKFKFFKTDNSYCLRLTKSDKEFLHVQPGDGLKKTISPNDQTITCRKKQLVSATTKKIIKQLFDENKDLMERLKDE